VSLTNLSAAFEQMRKERDYFRIQYLHALPCQCQYSGAIGWGANGATWSTTSRLKCYRCTELERPVERTTPDA
jgi:hypothetical protein